MASSFTIEQNGEVKTTISYMSSGVQYMRGEFIINTSETTYSAEIKNAQPGSFIYEHEGTPTKILIDVKMPKSDGETALYFNIIGLGGDGVSNESETGFNLASMDFKSTNEVIFGAKFVVNHVSNYMCTIRGCTIGGIAYGEVPFSFVIRIDQ